MPEKIQFKQGCWKGLVMEQGHLLNGIVKIDYINFEHSHGSTSKYSDEKFDQICIFKIERIANNPDLNS